MAVTVAGERVSSVAVQLLSESLAPGFAHEVSYGGGVGVGG